MLDDLHRLSLFEKNWDSSAETLIAPKDYLTLFSMVCECMLGFRAFGSSGVHGDQLGLGLEVEKKTAIEKKMNESSVF